MLFETNILSHREVATGTQEVILARPDDFSFQAGQHMQIQLPKLRAPDPKGSSRLFSVVSSPYDMECLKVVFRSSGSGFKNTLLDMSPVDPVVIEQASGSFILPQSPAKHNVFIAGGVGIAPFMSYLEQRVSDVWDKPITLIYGNRSPENAAYLADIQKMETEQSLFSCIGLYEKPTQEVFQKYVAEFPGAVWWVVGPPAMVSVVVAGLESGGVGSSDILTESFEGY